MLQELLTRPASRDRRYRLGRVLDLLYVEAVKHDGSVSLGSGADLYRAVNRRIQAEMDAPDDKHRQALVDHLLTLYRAAEEKRIAGAVDDLRQFAFKRLPEVLKRQRNEYETIVGNVAWLDNEAARTGLGNPIVRRGSRT